MTDAIVEADSFPAMLPRVDVLCRADLRDQTLELRDVIVRGSGRGAGRGFRFDGSPYAQQLEQSIQWDDVDGERQAFEEFGRLEARHVRPGPVAHLEQAVALQFPQ
jgi:hypothetical protein